LHITLGCDAIQTNREEKIQAKIYSLLDARTDTTYIIDNKIGQQQFYCQASFVLPRMYSLKLFGNFIFNQYTTINSKDTTYIVDTNLAVITNYTFTSSTSSNVNYLVGTTIEKEIRKFKLGLSVSYSSLNSNNQIQGLAYGTWYPKGNTNLAFNAQLTVFHQNGDVRYIPSIESIFRASKKCWVSAHVLYGDLTNTTEMNGQLVNNITDKTTYRTGSTLFYSMNKNLILHITYRYSLRESNYVTYTDKTNYTINYNNYNNHLFAIGIKYNL
jgi:hypothetical protein